jgi:hypothetical protein
MPLNGGDEAASPAATAITTIIAGAAESAFISGFRLHC